MPAELWVPPGRHWVFPLIKAKYWTVLPSGLAMDGLALQRGAFRAIVSGSTELDGKRWVHLSVSRKDRIPSWAELTEARDEILGEEAKCVLVFAPKSQHVNIHPFCMHLWHCVDEDVLPDFTRGGKTI